MERAQDKSAQEQGESSRSLHAREDGSRKGEYQGLNESGEFQRREEERSRLPGEFARPILENEGLHPGSLTAGGRPREKDKVEDVDVDGDFSGEKENMTRGKRRGRGSQLPRRFHLREEEGLNLPGDFDVRDGEDKGS